MNPTERSAAFDRLSLTESILVYRVATLWMMTMTPIQKPWNHKEFYVAWDSIKKTTGCTDNILDMVVETIKRCDHPNWNEFEIHFNRFRRLKAA